MWKSVCVLLYLCAVCHAGPLAAAYQKRKITPLSAREDSSAPPVAEEVEVPEVEEPAPSNAEAKPLISSTLTLPSNATSIRADITDNFSCTNKTYGYYADVENDCQIFHVCLPVTYADGKENIFRWSFICPEETIFNQESFTCMRREDMTIECEDSYRYYELNGNFGAPIEEEKPAENAAEESKPMDAEATEEAPIESEPETVSKPVKVEKPKRKPGRPKPASLFKQPVRKAPETAKPTAEQEEIQAEPAAKPQRVSALNKEKPLTQTQTHPHPQLTKPVRSDFFLSQRKRNKPSSTTTTTARPIREEALVEVVEPKPTLAVETLFQEAPPVPVVKIEEPLPEASETSAAVLFAQPEVPRPVQEELKPQEQEEELKKAEPIEAVEEIPAVIVESLEDVKKPEEAVLAETEPIKKETEQEENEEPAKVVEISQPEDTPLEPSIVESSNSHEEESSNALNQIEELEAQKPADAPESMPATEAMEQPNPLIEEILENSNSEAQQSLGGFKPVDPVMAAEAEQLITDFLNTLKKKEEKTETEFAMELAETLDKEADKRPVAEMPEGDSIEELKLPEPEIVDKNASVEEQLLEEDQKQEKDSPIINIMQLSHPEDYQIPVQIVSMEKEPITEIDVKPVNGEEGTGAAEAEVKPHELHHDDGNGESLVTAAYMPPISIDDIVELVKERLDQTPKTEQMAPMELVLTPGAEEPMALIQSVNQNELPDKEAESESESKSESEKEREKEKEKEDEEIILPIYKRLNNADLAMSNLQTLPVTANKVEGEIEPAKEAEPQSATILEVREPKSTLKMDARKRRFLFRADAS